MKAIYDHFLVIKTQKDIDAEEARITAEMKAIDDAAAAKNQIILPDSEKLKQDERLALKVESYVNNEVLTIHSTGHLCDIVKPGDRVIVRANTRPELTKIGDKFYYSYPERSVSVLFEKDDK